jgi:hypothetical protein
MQPILRAVWLDLSSYQELKVIHRRASVLGETINADTKELTVLPDEDVEDYV